jgi:hypothetical protein
LDQVPEHHRDMLPLFAELQARYREVEALMARVTAARKEIAVQMSAILEVDLIRRQPTVAEIGAAVRRIADLP